MKLSIIVPTIDRPSLAVTLESIKRQGLLLGDEVLLIGDGHCPVAEKFLEKYELPGRYLELSNRHNDWGAACRQKGIYYANGDYLLFMDDDDIYEDGALNVVRAKLSTGPAVPHVFRMKHLNDRIIWEDKELRIGNLSTQSIVVPNDKNKLGKWIRAYECDYYFMAETVNRYNGQVVWCEEIISKWRA